MNLPEFIAGLQSARINVDAESLADLLFYASQIPSAVQRTHSDNQHPPSDSSQAPPPQESTASTKPETVPSTSRTETNRIPDVQGLYATNNTESKNYRPAEEIEVPEAPPLPRALEIARALRPFSRRFDSQRLGDLDEDSTAERTAHEHHLHLIFHNRHERWFDVALIVEDTPSMAIWKRTVDAFERLLVNHGAFRDVRRWRITADGALADSSNRLVSPTSLLAPDGRRMVLILTHGVSTAWQSRTLMMAISDLARRQPTAVIQMLPERLWENSLIGEPKATASSPRPGLPNSQWEVSVAAWMKRRTPDALPIPVITLDPESMQNWADMLMARFGTAVPSAYWSATNLASESTSPTAPPEESAQLSAEQRYQNFQHISLEAGRRLAANLAAGPVNLPILRLVNQTLFAENACRETIAEVLLGGIVRKVGDNPDPEQADYDFYPNLRNLFAATLNSVDRFAVRRQVMRYLEQHPDTTQRFRALVPHKDGKRQLPEWAMPFADQDEEFLRKHGLLVDDQPKEKPKPSEPVGPEFDELLRMLPEWLPSQLWFRGGTHKISHVSIRDWVDLPYPKCGLAFVRVELANIQPAQTYVIPIVKSTGIWMTGVDDEVSWLAMLALFNETSLLATHQGGSVRSNPGKRYQEFRGPTGFSLTDLTFDYGPEGTSAVTFDDRVRLSVLRYKEIGEDPDVVISRYLCEDTGFAYLTAYVGTLEYVDHRGRISTLATLRGHLPISGTAFGLLAPNRRTDLRSAETITSTLGQICAQMHAALARAPLPSLSAFPIDSNYLAALADQMTQRASSAFSWLETQTPLLVPSSTRDLFDRVIRLRPIIEATFERLKFIHPDGKRITIHGNLGLHEFLAIGDSFVVKDFRGYYSQSQTERLAKRSPLIDVASMLRSIAHAVGTRRIRAGGFSPDLNELQNAARDSFLRAYREEAARSDFLPSDPTDLFALLDAFLIDQFLDAVVNPVQFESDLVDLSLQEIINILDRSSAQSEQPPIGQNDLEPFLRTLPEFLPQQRWFKHKALTISRVAIYDFAALPNANVALAFIAVTCNGNPDTDLYLMPLVRKNDVWAEGTSDILVWSTIFSLMENVASGTTNDGFITAHLPPDYHAIRGPAGSNSIEVKNEAAEIVVTYGNRLTLKMPRQLGTGPHPDVEFSRFFLEHTTFNHVLPYAGSIQYTNPRTASSNIAYQQPYVAGANIRTSEPIDIAYMQAHISDATDAWQWAIAEFKNFASQGTLPEPTIRQIQLLARRFAQMHIALGSGRGSAFVPRAADSNYLRDLFGQMLTEGEKVLLRLEELQRGHIANALLAINAAMAPSPFSLIRIHGDLHLACILRTGDDFLIADFENAEIEKQCALKDVAALLFSFSYAARSHQNDSVSDAWDTQIHDIVINSYLAETGPQPFLPSDLDDLKRLLTAFELHKALQALDYELSNRPEWAAIALASIRLLTSDSSSTPARAEAPIESPTESAPPLDMWLRFAPKPKPLPSNYRWHLFISNTQADFILAVQIQSSLSALGYKVFLFNPSPDTSFPASFVDELIASKNALVIWSHHAARSSWMDTDAKQLSQRKLYDSDFHYALAQTDDTTVDSAIVAERVDIGVDFSDRNKQIGQNLLWLLCTLAGTSLPDAAVSLRRELEIETQRTREQITAARANRDGAQLLQLARSTAPAWLDSATLSCAVADALISIGDILYLDAIRICEETSIRFPRAFRPKQLLGLVHALLNDGKKAEQILDPLYASGDVDFAPVEWSNDLRIAQTDSQFRSDGWKWSVWIEGPEDQLDFIDFVEWHLHKTFPQPILIVKDKASYFGLSGEAWGTFLVRAQLHLKDGRAVPLKEELELHRGSDGMK